jgi:hypothetical protein
MSPILAGVALAVAAGAVIAASSREARAGLIGLTLVLALGPFLSDPIPGPAILGARVVTGILVAYLLRAAAGADEPAGIGSRIGWPATGLFALAAAIAGLSIASGLASLEPSGPPRAGGTDIAAVLTAPALALAAGLASLAVGLAPALLGRKAWRTGIGLLLVVQGVVLARVGVAGPPGELEQLGIDGFVLTLGAAAAMLTIIDRRAGSEAPASGTAADDARAVRPARRTRVRRDSSVGVGASTARAGLESAGGASTARAGLESASGASPR